MKFSWVKRTYESAFGADVQLVSDRAGWVFDRVADYLRRGAADFPLSVGVTDQPWTLRRRVIHFIDRYFYFDGPSESLDSSNRIFLNWYHANPDTSDVLTQKLYADLSRTEPGIERIIVSCDISRRDLLARGIPEEKLTLIPIGVDLSTFIPIDPENKAIARKRLGIPETALCIGSFQKDGVGWGEGMTAKSVKGPDIFLRVVDRLKEQCGNIIVLLTGPARGFVKAGLDRIGVPWIHRNVSDYHDMVRCYHALDLYIIASRVEGGPKALMESWACGVPVVSTRVGMPADLVRHRENGMIAEIDDADALATAARELLDDTALRARCVHAGFADVYDCSWTRVAERHCRELYLPAMASIRSVGGSRKKIEIDELSHPARTQRLRE